MNKHELEMIICKILIDSDLSITDQLKVIESVRERLKFCKETGQKMSQLSFDFK
jgi:hypothetical protein